MRYVIRVILGWRGLFLAIIWHAALDAIRGDADAADWLRDDGILMLDLLGLSVDMVGWVNLLDGRGAGDYSAMLRIGGK